MKTKESILAPGIYKNVQGFGDAVTPDFAEEAMDEYAKQQAIDFLNFACRIAWYDTDVYLWNLYDETADPFRLSNEEMYQLLIQEQNNL